MLIYLGILFFINTDMECYKNVIGFAREACDCIEGWDDDYALSKSGLFITELQGMSLRMLDSLGGCEDLWAKMTAALENAVNTFKLDLSQGLAQYKQPRRKRFNGVIGDKSFNRLAPDSNYYGLRMYSDILGGSFILRGVTLLHDDAETLNLEIYDDDELLHTVQVETAVNRPALTMFDTPIELPLDGNYYFLVTPFSSRAYQNKLTCGCGGFRWCFDIASPCLTPSRDGWTEWAMVGGVWGEDVNERQDWAPQKQGGGMILHGNFVCDAFYHLCNESTDFSKDEGLAMAWAILYKAGEFLTNYIMGSPEVTRYTLLGLEQLDANRQYYSVRYEVLIDYLSQTVEDNECLMCKPPQGVRFYSQRL